MTNKNLLITGGSTRIGREIALHFSKKGWNIVIHYFKSASEARKLKDIIEKNSVKVEELCGIYTFETVHQMISSVSATIKPHIRFIDILKATFPMGSMTGAPKIRAMELIEKYESTKRGVYSGCVGYIKPNGDFDFNVIIRTLLYNSKKKYLSCMVGGAITSKSNEKEEYQETLLKAEALLQALK